MPLQLPTVASMLPTVPFRVVSCRVCCRLGRRCANAGSTVVGLTPSEYVHALDSGQEGNVGVYRTKKQQKHNTKIILHD